VCDIFVTVDVEDVARCGVRARDPCREQANAAGDVRDEVSRELDLTDQVVEVPGVLLPRGRSEASLDRLELGRVLDVNTCGGGGNRARSVVDGWLCPLIACAVSAKESHGDRP